MNIILFNCSKCLFNAYGKVDMVFEKFIARLIRLSRINRKKSFKLMVLFVDEFFFLAIIPWICIIPSNMLATFLTISFPRHTEILIAVISIPAGIFISIWSVVEQWKRGEGTPALNAPTRRLVISGPYTFCRNPIQLGSVLYFLGLGTLIFSLLAGVIALCISLFAGLAYIKLIEEKELELRFGKDYIIYKEETPLIFPFIRKRN